MATSSDHDETHCFGEAPGEEKMAEEEPTASPTLEQVSGLLAERKHGQPCERAFRMLEDVLGDKEAVHRIATRVRHNWVTRCTLVLLGGNQELRVPVYHSTGEWISVDEIIAAASKVDVPPNAVEYESLANRRCGTQWSRAEDDTLLLHAFRYALQGVMERPLMQQFITRHEELVQIRGSLDIQAQVRTGRWSHTGDVVPPFCCNVVDTTVDCPPNRLLVSALDAILHTHATLPEETGAYLRMVYGELCLAVSTMSHDEIARLDFRSDVLETLGPGCEHYEPALQLGRAILHRQSLTVTASYSNGTLPPLPGIVWLQPFAVFEELVRHQLNQRSSAEARAMDWQVDKKSDDIGTWHGRGGCSTRATINPDLVFRRDQEIIAVGDVKMKVHVKGPPVSTHDFYQIVFYSRWYGNVPAVVIVLGDTKEESWSMNWGGADGCGELPQLSVIAVKTDRGQSLHDDDMWERIRQQTHDAVMGAQQTC